LSILLFKISLVLLLSSLLCEPSIGYTCSCWLFLFIPSLLYFSLKPQQQWEFCLPSCGIFLEMKVTI
jgi:hypothetical protein